MADVLSVLDWIAALLFAGAIGLIALTPDEIKIARVLVWGAALIFSTRWVMWAIVTEQSWQIRAVVGAVCGAFLFSVVPPSLGWLAKKAQVSAAQSILRIYPKTLDIQVKWGNGEIVPLDFDGNSPFALNITNIGPMRAIDVEITFSINADADRIIDDFIKSDILRGSKRKQGMLFIPVEWNKDNITASKEIAISGIPAQKIPYIDSVSGANTLIIDCPTYIKNILSLYSLLRAYEADSQERADAERRNKRVFELLQSGDHEGMADELRSRLRYIEMPDITIEIKYADSSGLQYSGLETIKSIYSMLSYIGAYGDIKKPGFIYFSGGMGHISFEDKNNKDKGHYNMMKRDK